MTGFDPARHLIQLKGKPYLETRFRIAWFRQAHPHGWIGTEILRQDPVLVRATIRDGDGALLATAHAGALDKGNAAWRGRSLEKAETAAVGRALAHAGFGLPAELAERSTAAVSGPVSASSQRTWLDNTSARDAFCKRLRVLDPNLTLRDAQDLLGVKPLSAFKGSEAAFKAVAEAYDDRLRYEQPA